METNDVLIFGLLFLIIVSRLSAPLIEVMNDISSFFKIIFSPITLIILSMILFILINIKFHFWWLKHSIEKENKKNRINENLRILKELLNKSPKNMNLKALGEYLLELRKVRIPSNLTKEYSSKISERTKEVKIIFEGKKHLKELERIEYEKNRLQDENERLKQENYEEILKSKDNEKAILRKLEIEENCIYEFEDLKSKEINVLKEKKFEVVSEYDPIFKRNKKFLIKKIMNHSSTHTFLVWRIKQLLEQYIDSEDIKISNTIGADITFKINSKYYAFEIEIGNLLHKKKQLNEKIEYLNKKYKNRWYFIVSHRDLVKKYIKYGNVTTRVGVGELIEKLTDF